MESTLLTEDFTREIAFCWALSLFVLGGLMTHALAAYRGVKK